MSLTLDTYLSKIIPALPINEIQELCQTKPIIRSWCRNEPYWQDLTLKYYPDAGLKPTRMPWFDFYIESYKYANLIMHVYPNAQQKPKNLTYAQYAKLLNP